MTVKTHTGSSLYFIALIPDADIEQELHEFKLELFEKYQCKAALKSPAHITLIPPFTWANFQAEKIIEIFKYFHPSIQPFDITVEGFDTFGTQVFFARPLYEEKLYLLQSSVKQHFEPTLKDKIRDRFQFHPHITIANRDLRATDLPEIIKSFEIKKYRRAIRFREISLLRHNGTKWEIVSKISL